MTRILAVLFLMLFCVPALAQQNLHERLSVLSDNIDSREELEPLETLVIARHGEIVIERGYHGHKVTGSTNIKSASKSVMSALVGIAIDKGLLEGVDQKIAPLLKKDLPASPDPRLNDITIGHLLSMQSGLRPMSGTNYGRWVSSRNWVRFALAQPFEGKPGEEMLYSTASTHLLSAILTKVSGRSTLALAREWLGPVEGFRIGAWQRDPQGIYLGGNQMAMSARSLLAFGELYHRGGKTSDNRQIIPASWIEQSWQTQTHSIFSGDAYGYGWFQQQIGGETVQFAYGYGGQMLYIVPSLQLTVVMTSNDRQSAAHNGYRFKLDGVLAEIIALTKMPG